MPEEAVKPLTVTTERTNGEARVSCKGRLVAGTTDEFYGKARPLLTETKTLIVDLEHVSYMDSMGLGVMVRLYVSARQHGVELKVTHVGTQVRNLFKLTNLTSVLGEAESHGITVA